MEILDSFSPLNSICLLLPKVAVQSALLCQACHAIYLQYSSPAFLLTPSPYPPIHQIYHPPKHLKSEDSPAAQPSLDLPLPLCNKTKEKHCCISKREKKGLHKRNSNAKSLPLTKEVKESEKNQREPCLARLRVLSLTSPFIVIPVPIPISPQTPHCKTQRVKQERERQ